MLLSSHCKFSKPLVTFLGLTHFSSINFFALLCEAILVVFLICCLFWATKTFEDVQNSVLAYCVTMST